MSTLKVNAIRNTSASSDAITLASDGTATAKITNNLSNRNLIINGAMQVAQRGTSSTTSGMSTLDRWENAFSGQDEALTQAQHALTSSDTGPWEKGFRNSLHITNGNQTSGAGTSDNSYTTYGFEAQDIANSGWNYTSTSSYITLSFWIKSSVAQDFKGYLKTEDGTEKSYPFATGSLSADTWTKVTKTIPGHADLQFDNDTDKGLVLTLFQFIGTGSTGSVTENAWANWSGSTQTADQTSTWWTTNNATWEITGVQLEVGDVATDFEHRSYGDELARCQRYYWENEQKYYGFQYSSGYKMCDIPHPVEMRVVPTETMTVHSGSWTHISETTTKFMAYASSAYDSTGVYFTKVVFNAEL
tara:strand:- start:213 stop:1289 length:1077 start_codon:yes stop_codon:yes gene_type:complete